MELMILNSIDSIQFTGSDLALLIAWLVLYGVYKTMQAEISNSDRNKE